MPQFNHPTHLAALQRLRYWQGQQVQSQDFRDQGAIAAQQQAWHNVALHNAYGIAAGFTIQQESNVIRIQPGTAYDCFGQLLYLQRAKTIPLPDAQPDADWLLLMTHNPTTSFARSKASDSAQLKQGRTIEEPLLRWSDPFQWSPKMGIPLARLHYNPDTAQWLIAEAMKPYAHPLARPHMGSGETVPGNTAWKAWFASEARQHQLGFEVDIDTSAEGFTEVPCYFAWLQGDWWPKIKWPQADAPRPQTLLKQTFRRAAESSLERFIPAPLTHIAETSSHRFKVRIWLPSMHIPGFEHEANEHISINFPLLAQQQRLYVCWLGIQSSSHCHHQREDIDA